MSTQFAFATSPIKPSDLVKFSISLSDVQSAKFGVDKADLTLDQSGYLEVDAYANGTPASGKYIKFKRLGKWMPKKSTKSVLKYAKRLSIEDVKVVKREGPLCYLSQMPYWMVRASRTVFVATTYDVEKDYFFGKLRLVYSPEACYQETSTSLSYSYARRVLGKVQKTIAKEALAMIEDASENGELKEDK